MNQLQTLIDTRRTSFPSGRIAENMGHSHALQASSPRETRRVLLRVIRWYGANVTVKLPPLLPTPAERIKAVVAAGNIKEARRLMAQALEESPGDAQLQRLANLIAPPRLVAARPARNVAHLEANRRWIRDFGNEHRGQWIAVRDGRLLGAAGSVAELRALVGDTKGALVTRIA